jgi:AraC family transcriptional regulator, regulatory protein of adaptative response / DNA-3-methyladenine glycosylase II
MVANEISGREHPLSPWVSGPGAPLDHDSCYRAVLGRDARFDGWFVTAVKTTGIYCRPSCPTPVLPKSQNVVFFRTSAAAQQSGYRSCKRCRPDATPGSPEWNLRSDLTGRALRLIADGLVDREGVTGLAKALFVSERHLNRSIQLELGTGPLAISRAQRAQTARVLIETTSMNFADVAFAAGFSSVRQFNDTVTEVFATTPTNLRSHRRVTDRTATAENSMATAGTINVRLPFRKPYDVDSIFQFLIHRAIAGVEVAKPNSYRRTLRLPSGPGSVSVVAADDHLQATFQLTSLSDLGAATARIRRLFDLDADPVSIADALSADRRLAPAVQANLGLRCPGSVDPHEVAVRAILGQQVSVAAARTHGSRLAELVASKAIPGDPELPYLFPSAEDITPLSPSDFAMPIRRAETLIGLARALHVGDVVLSPGADRAQARHALELLPGIGPWTSGYISLRGLSDPDVCLHGDLVAVHGARALGLASTPAELEVASSTWAPWRSYATHLLWASARKPEPKAATKPESKAVRKANSRKDRP